MKISEQQAIDYIEAARDLSALASLLLEQSTDNTKKLKNKIEAKSADALYRLWFLLTEHLCEKKIKKHIENLRPNNT
mgnify:CR=1 FL=1|tara:strand:- start:532 stop:762 length:231 start_codon:yes stop_codon:yes gene_type:complete